MSRSPILSSQRHFARPRTDTPTSPSASSILTHVGSIERHAPSAARLPLQSKRHAGWSVSEILEVGGDAEIAAAYELNDSLQLVFLLARDANLPVLQLALDFEPLGFDRLDKIRRAHV